MQVFFSQTDGALDRTLQFPQTEIQEELNFERVAIPNRLRKSELRAVFRVLSVSSATVTRGIFRPQFITFAPIVWHFRSPPTAASRLELVVAGAKYYEVVNTSELDVWLGEFAEISASLHRSAGGTFPPYGVAAKHSTEHERGSPMEADGSHLDA